jgi:uncharacterized protein YbjT (DUF2867 family)
MSARPIVTVIGATGAQGGGLARAILADPSRSFAVRAVARQPDCAAARALAAQGAEVVQADLDDAASVERAMRGAYGVFAVDDSSEHHSARREPVQARHVAEAARRAAVRHVIWSTLEYARQFDARGAADSPFGELPVTYLRTSFRWDDLVDPRLGLRRGGDGVLEFLLPMGTRRLPGIAADDIGPCALGVFQRCGQFIGCTVGIAGEHLTGAEMAAALSAAIGEPVRHVPLSLADCTMPGFPDSADLARLFRYQTEFNEACCAGQPVDRTRELHPDVMNFERWLAHHAHRVAVPART